MLCEMLELGMQNVDRGENRRGLSEKQNIHKRSLGL